jgi:nicotinate dehydrogenase subunit A
MTSTPAPGITLTINGQEQTLNVDPGTPLLLALRNDAGLVSVRYGCGIGRCGACTVLVDGEPVQACTIRTGDVRGAEVRTVEGLAAGDDLHPVQQAFLDLQAAQCGYCIPGIIMRSVALLRQQPHPTRDGIREALDGHLCRCGTHVRILNAIERAATLLEAPE